MHTSKDISWHTRQMNELIETYNELENTKYLLAKIPRRKKELDEKIKTLNMKVLYLLNTESCEKN